MPVYVIARGRIHDPKKHDAYVAAAVPTLPPEAKLLSFDRDTEVIEGPESHPRTVLIEFPTRESFLSWYNSPQYQKVKHLRLESVEGTMVLAKA